MESIIRSNTVINTVCQGKYIKCSELDQMDLFVSLSHRSFDEDPQFWVFECILAMHRLIIFKCFLHQLAVAAADHQAQPSVLLDKFVVLMDFVKEVV